MIIVEITKDGIEKVSIQATSDTEQDKDIEIWALVRRRLNQIVRDLEKLKVKS